MCSPCLCKLCAREHTALTSISRKEVIQPHLPVRLPCYDFTPVMKLTVVSASPRRLGNRLLVNPTPMV